jgi:hypothetical protein
MSNPDSVGCQCRDHERSTLDRPALFLPLIVAMFASFGLLLGIADLPFGVQLGSLMPYTCLIVLATFSAQRGQQPYFFQCEIVQSTVPRLIKRHMVFLAAIVVIETVAFRATRYMPPSWLVAKGRDGSPVAISLCVLCLALAFVQILSNRSLIARAHRENNVLL